MSKDKTEASKYKSVTTGDYCTAAQFLAEMMCIREAAKNKVRLVGKFWNNPEWKLKFRQHIVAANGLLKIYDATAIIRALNSKAASWVYSLRWHGLNQLILEQQVELDKLAAREVKTIEVTETSSVGNPTKPFGKQSVLNKLREIEENHKG